MSYGPLPSVHSALRFSTVVQRPGDAGECTHGKQRRYKWFSSDDLELRFYLGNQEDTLQKKARQPVDIPIATSRNPPGRVHS